MTKAISFEVHDVLDPGLDYEVTAGWLVKVALQEKKEIGALDYIFCNDSFLLQINSDFLQHDNYTDIITFPYSYEPIESEIYISLERVVENASTFGNGNATAELLRVIVHGLLHMCGYSDHTDADKKIMRQLETKYVAQHSLASPS